MSKYYNGDLESDSCTQMRLAKNSHELAEFYRWLGLSGDMTMSWIVDQLSFYHTGLLIGPDGRQLSVEELKPEDLFGRDVRRTINRFKKENHLARKQALAVKLVPRIMVMDFAMQVFLKTVD